jgi:hypothetical protein
MLSERERSERVRPTSPVRPVARRQRRPDYAAFPKRLKGLGPSTFCTGNDPRTGVVMP